MRNTKSVVDAFNDTKVQSCREVKYNKGLMLAIGYTHPIKSEAAPKLDGSTVNNLTYCNRIQSHAGMLHKPLERYSPNANRSRMQSPQFSMPRYNDSQVEIGTPIKRSKFITMSQTHYKVPVHTFTTNQGIISERNREANSKKGY